MKLILIRHAPTQYNEINKFMGSLDIPLSQKGTFLAKKFKNENIIQSDKIFFSSPLQRAYQTSKIIFNNERIIIDNRLKERSLGEWAGIDKNIIKMNYPEAFLASGHLNPYFIPNEGEIMGDMIRRVSSFLFDIEQYENKNIYVVSHNGVIRLVRSLLENQPIMEMFFQSEPYLSPRIYYFNEESKKWRTNE